MKVRRFAALLLAALLLLSACGREVSSAPVTEDPAISPQSPAPTGNQPPVPREVFALAWDDTAPLDPLTTTNSVNLLLAGLVYEGLFALDGAFQPQLQLCDSYTAAEGAAVWTFRLKEGVCFSDGTPLTGAHVAAALNTARSSALYSSRLAAVESVSAEGLSVVVTLSSPNGSFPALLDIPVTLPAGDGQPPLGTGPYSFDLTGGDPLLRSNPHYPGGGQLPLDTIPLYAASSPDRRVAAFDAGLVSVVASDLTAANALGYSSNYETWSAPTTAMLYLGFHCQTGPCSDPVLRQAISRAVERSVVAESLLFGQADAARLPLSPLSELYDKTLAGELDYSLSDAAGLLADGGYALNGDGVLSLGKGALPPLRLLVNGDNPVRVDVAEYLAEELPKLGLAVEVVSLPWEEYLAALTAGNFDLYLAQVRLTADFDLSPLLFGELNYGQFVDVSLVTGEPIVPDPNATEDEPVETGIMGTYLAAARGVTGTARKAVYSALYAYWASVLPFTPLCFTRTAALTRWGLVSGANPTQQNIFHQFHLWNLS